MITIKSLPHIK